MELVNNNNPVCIDNFHDENRQVINVNFGKGQIGVSAGLKRFHAVNDEYLPYVSFEVLKEKIKIGADLIDTKEDYVNHDYPEVHLNFTNDKSVDVVIKALKEIKKFLKQSKEDKK